MCMTASIVFFDVDPRDMPRVLAEFPNAVFEPAELRDEVLAATCKDAEIISTFITTPFTASVLEKLPNLKLLCTRSVGFDHLDMAYCREKGIVVCNVPDTDRT
jgi:D-lactate dehydrogenase